jgi:large subunit ribosomal protein L15
MKAHDLQPAKGAKKERKRVGRGTGTGQGTYAGRGRKGQRARSGGTKAPYFEGGQLPLVRRLPHKRGFVNIFRVEYAEVNVDRLEQAFDTGAEVTPGAMAEAGLIKSVNLPVKVLGRGELSKPLTVEAHRFSAGARLKIEAAGGSIRELE